MTKLLMFIAALLLSVFAQATTITCFTPGENCTSKLIMVINAAQSSIKVQSYSFTSKPIIDALINAHKRGVDVKIILDKSQFNKVGHAAVKEAGIPVWIDYRPAIAHNKTMIFDEEAIETGSFNYSEAAQSKNAENYLMTDEMQPVDEYVANWKKRLSASISDDAYALLKR